MSLPFEPRIEDHRLLTGAGRFLDDERMAGAAHAVFVRSPHAFATIRGIDTAEARRQPGVLSVLTAGDMERAGVGNVAVVGPIPNGAGLVVPLRPALAGDCARHVGDAVALVVAESEAAARDVAFRNKEIDTSVLGPAQYVAYQADPGLKSTIVEVAEVFTRYMGMNPAFKPFADKRVRQAINHAIDTDLIISKLVKGKAYRATSWLPLTSPVYDKTMKPYAFDPAKAKQLLADAGYPTGFEFEWTASQNESWGLPIVTAIIPMLDRVGIKAKVKQVETAVLAEVVRSGDFQAYVYSQSTGPDPLAALKCYYSKTPQTACNYMSFKNADFDKIIDDAGQTDDTAKRIQLLQKANALLYEEAPVWFFNYNKAVMAVQPWLKGVQLNPTELTHQNVEDLWVTEASPAK